MDTDNVNDVSASSDVILRTFMNSNGELEWQVVSPDAREESVHNEDEVDTETNKDTLLEAKQRTCRLICAFILFTIIAMTIGIIIVCLTAPDGSGQKCVPSFKRSAKPVLINDTRPKHVAIGDFNGDDQQDVVIVNLGINSIGILLTNQNKTLTTPKEYSTGIDSAPYWVSVGHFNNDTALDLAVANYGTNNIGIFLGYHNGTFASQMTFSLNASRPVSLAVEDFNNDSYFDIAVVSNGTFNLTILLGDGNGSFSYGSQYNMGYDSMPSSLAVTDFNNDSRPDIVIVNYGTSEIAILLGSDNGTFIIDKYSTGNGSHPCSVTVGDFNTDNYIDIAFVNCGRNNIGVFIGNGNGTFRTMKTYSTGAPSDLQFIVAGLISNDDKLDLVTVDSAGNNIIVFEGDGDGNFSFQANQTAGSTSHPCSIAVNDFDGDYISDIIVTNIGNNYALVLMSYGYQTTATQTVYATGDGSYPSSVGVGDFNNDSLLDIVVTNTYTNNIGVFMGSSDGAFEDQITFPVIWDSAGPSVVSVGDFNNDKRLDIAVAEYWIGAIDIYLGQGTNSFEYQYTMWMDSYYYPNSLTNGHFNNDTYLDIATSSCFPDSLIVFLADGNGTFQDGTIYALNYSSCPMNVVVGDFNNDNISDLASANYLAETISILMGFGNGSFQNPITILVTYYYATSLVVGYLNNDKYQDIVVLSSDDSSIGILLGKGNGTFQDVYPYFTGYNAYPSSIVLGSFNKDNLTDIAVTNLYDNSLVIFFGDGKGTFTRQDPISLEDVYFPYSMATGYFDNDKEMDIVVTNTQTDDISVLLLKHEVNFRNQTNYYQGSGSHPYFLTSVDFNNNQQIDIIVTNSANDTVQILMDYQNNGTFMSNITYSTGLSSHPTCVIAYDFNKDNYIDLAIVTSYTSYLIIYLLFGNGTLLKSYSYSTGYYAFPSSLALGDFNQDGWIDIVVANNNTNNIGVFFGYAYATFLTYNMSAPDRGYMPYYVVAADFNKDSICDFAVAYRAKGAIGIFLGNGNGTFLNQTTYLNDWLSKPVSLAIGNFNNDTILDLAVANGPANSISILLGTDNGTYNEYTDCLTGDGSPVSIAVSDFNNDTIQDIVVVSSNGNFTGIFMGYENGSFSNQTLYPMPYGSSPSWVIVHDFNKDNIADIATANYGIDSIGIYLGFGNGSFRNLTMYSTGNRSGPASIDAGDFNKDNCIDIAIANQKSKNVGIMLGDCTGKFALQTIYSTGVRSVLSSITVKDFNNDTILDIAVTDSSTGTSNIAILYGMKNGTFLVPKLYPTGLNSAPTSNAVCDFNNDSLVDLAITNSKKNSISIMFQGVSQPFGEQTTYSTGNASRPYSVTVTDFNNDGRLDIATANIQANNISLFYGYGNGSFADQISYSTGNDSHPMFIATGFVNDDKHIDIVVSNEKADNFVIFYGYGNRTFGNMERHLTGPSSGPTSVALADFNKDNHTDIVVTNAGTNMILVFYGYGNGTFQDAVSFKVDYSDIPISVTTGDYNNDSLLDIGVANYGLGYVEVLLRTC